MKWDQIKEKVQMLVVHDSSIKSSQLLAQLLYIHMFGGIEYSPMFLFIGIAYTITFQENYFWHIGIIIGPNLGYLIPINLLFGLLSCNEQWKTLLFLYCLGDLIFMPYVRLNEFYNVLALGGLMYESYFNLPFRNIKENILFFSCLSIIWAFEIILFLNSHIDFGEIHFWYFLALVLSTVLFASYRIIKSQISSILNSKLEVLECPSHIIHFIESMESKMKDKIQREGIEKAHRSECYDADCQCCSSQTDFDRLFLRQLYYRGFKKFENTEYDESLHEFYIYHLIKAGQLVMALEITLKQKAKKFNFYQFIRQKRILLLLREELSKIEQQYQIQVQTSDPFSYQYSFDTLKCQLLELIQLKINYWQQTSKRKVRIFILRSLGRDFLRKLSKMHQYYLNNVKNFQKQVHSFSGSIIYNLFLFIATNYKQLAEKNIKQLKKSVDLTNVPANLQQNYKYFVVKASLCEEKLGVIENVNKSFSKLLGTDQAKVQFLGTNIQTLIPTLYLKQHREGIKRFRIQGKSKMFGNQINPLFISNSIASLVPCSMVLRYSSDIENEFSVVGIIKQLKKQCEYMMLDVNNHLCYSTQGFSHTEVLELESVKEVIETFKDKWKGVTLENPVFSTPDPIKIQIKVDDNTFTIEVFCKMAQSFRFPMQPPIMVSVHNETQTYFFDQDIADDMQVGCMKKLSNVIDQFETESQSSMTNQKNQIITILQNFQKNSNFRAFKALCASIIIAFVLMASGLGVHHNVVNLSWTKIQSGPKNPNILLRTLYQLQIQISRVISKSLSIYGIDRGFISEDDFGQIYGSYTYKQDARNSIYSVCNQLKDIVSGKIVINDILDSKEYQEVLNRKLFVKTSKSEQQIYFSSLLRVFISDCYILSKNETDGHVIPDLIVTKTFWSTYFPHMFTLIQTLENISTNMLVTFYNLNFILGSIIFLLLLISNVPVYLNSKRIERHEDYIYQLMSSLEPELLQRQVNQLIDLQSSLKVHIIQNFDIDDQKSSLLPNGTNGFDDVKSQNKGLSQSGRRKRPVQLIRDNYERPKAFFYGSILLFILFLTGIFLVKHYQIVWLQSILSSKIVQQKWRNQRLNLVLNIKKKTFNFEPNDTINKKSIPQWLRQTLSRRKSNYLVNDSLDYFQFNCSERNQLCRSSSLLNQLSINMFEETLLSEAAEDNLPARIPFIEQLEEASYTIYLATEPSKIKQIDLTMAAFEQYEIIVFYTALSFMVFVVFASYFNLKKIRKAYLECMRTLAFLSEEMIKKNKRVQSFLRILSKTE